MSNQIGCAVGGLYEFSDPVMQPEGLVDETPVEMTLGSYWPLERVEHFRHSRARYDVLTQYLIRSGPVRIKWFNSPLVYSCAEELSGAIRQLLKVHNAAFGYDEIVITTPSYLQGNIPDWRAEDYLWKKFQPKKTGFDRDIVEAYLQIKNVWSSGESARQVRHTHAETLEINRDMFLSTMTEKRPNQIIMSYGMQPRDAAVLETELLRFIEEDSERRNIKMPEETKIALANIILMIGKELIENIGD